jgi:hypothetical protein
MKSAKPRVRTAFESLDENGRNVLARDFEELRVGWNASSGQRIVVPTDYPEGGAFRE